MRLNHEAVPDEKVADLPLGQISRFECKMLYALAADIWTGQGEIVEIGSLYGKSTVCLARGVRDNKNKRRGRLHAFDKWMADEETAYMTGQMPGFRGSFRSRFDENTAAVKEWIVPHEGDVFDSEWEGKPIEILFIDCSVSLDFHEMLFRKFYPFLRRGSVVVQQDYLFYRSYYLPLMMAKLGPQLQAIGNVDTSMIFQMVDEFHVDVFKAPLVRSDDEIVASLEALIAAYASSEHGAIIAAMLVYFYHLKGEHQKASELADKTIPAWKPDSAAARNLEAACAPG